MRISHGATIDKTIGKQYNKGNETRRNAMPRKSKYFLFEIVGDVPDFFYSNRYVTQGTKLHFHRNWEIFCVFDGVVQATVDNETYVLESGMGVVIDSLAPHAFECTSAEISYTIIGTDIMQLFSQLYPGRTLPRFLPDKQANKPLMDFVTSIAMQVADYTPLEKYAHACNVLNCIIQAYGTIPADLMQHRANSTIYKAIAYIYDNYTQDISLTTIADYLHIQPQSLSNLLSKYLKTDLRNYINNLRIQEFYVLQKRPENKDLSVLELATLCGFSSLTTFYRAQKKYLDSSSSEPQMLYEDLPQDRNKQ